MSAQHQLFFDIVETQILVKPTVLSTDVRRQSCNCKIKRHYSVDFGTQARGPAARRDISCRSSSCVASLPQGSDASVLPKVRRRDHTFIG